MDGIKACAGLAGVRDIQTLERRAVLRRRDHRWNTSRCALPRVEEGTVVLVGATPESAFRSSRSARRWFDLGALANLILRSSIEHGRPQARSCIPSASFQTMHPCHYKCQVQDEDEPAIHDSVQACPTPAGTTWKRSPPHSARPIDERRDGDTHYDVASALMEESPRLDPDASRLARPRGGRGPHVHCSPLAIFAADVGNADPRALAIAVSGSTSPPHRHAGSRQSCGW